jgi:Leucine-rich repeat (LRR) protein
MAALVVLDLAHNKIAAIGAGVLPGWPQLRRLDLSHNALRALPDDMAQLT